MDGFLAWLKAHPSVKYGVPAIILLIGLPAWLFDASTPFRDALSEMAVNADGALKGWFVAALFGAFTVLLCCLIVALGLAGTLFRYRREAATQRPLSASGEMARKDFDRFTSNVRLILNKFDKRPNCEMESAHVTVKILSNGNVEYRRAHRLRANNENTVFNAFHEEADSSALPAYNFLDIGLEVTCLDDGCSTILLPMQNKSHYKEFAICFIPPLARGQTRNVEICHAWPRFCSDLIQRGRTTFHWQTLTTKPGSTMEATVELSFPAEWSNVACEIMGSCGPDGGLKRHVGPFGGVTWIFHDPQLPVGAGPLAIECVLDG